MSIVSVFFILIIILTVLIGWHLSTPPYKGPVTDHFNGKKFINPSGQEAAGFDGVLKWMVNRDKGRWEYKEVSPGPPPPVRVDSGCRITFVNHSTFLIQVDGLNILTDPIWSERASPFSFAGPKRMRPPGIRFEDLPPIDIILLSHNHYDHLDKSTLERLQLRNQPVVIAPLGNKPYLQSIGMTSIHSIDWWDTAAAHGLTIRAVPAQHFSGRGLFDRDKSLWAGFVIESRWGHIYYAGDTGYGDFFKDIGQRYETIHVSLIPIGAYKPRWFMSPIHIGPEEALQVHKEVNSQFSIGCHFGTFPLADDGMTEPVDDLQKALEGVSSSNPFILLQEGQSRHFTAE